MRLNRKIRIGAALVALALLLLGLVTITRRLQPDAPLASTAGNTSANAVAQAGSTVAPPASSGRVAVARQNIPERSIVTSEMLQFRDARPGEESTTLVTDPNAQAVGFVTSRPIAAGREVRQADLLGHISDVGVAGALLPGRRAMILPIGNKATLHDLVRIGDRVDIVASFEQQEARVIAEDVRVLAVDVFGSDYPPVKIAMRGDYKAPARSVSAANPPSPAGSAAPAGGQPNPDAPAGQQPASGAPAAGAPATGPEPTPTQGPPPARPEASLTIEVTPQQATDIALTQAAGQNIDFLLRARTEPRVPAPGGPGTLGAPGSGGVTLASGEGRSATFTTRDRLAPNAARARKPATPAGSGAGTAGRVPARNASASGQSSGGASGSIGRGRSRSGGGSNYFPPTLPDVPPPSRSIPPANPNAGLPVFGPNTPNTPSRPTLSPTYDIPIVAGNKVLRVDTVRRPPANR